MDKALIADELQRNILVMDENDAKKINNVRKWVSGFKDTLIVADVILESLENISLMDYDDKLKFVESEEFSKYVDYTYELSEMVESIINKVQGIMKIAEKYEESNKRFLMIKASKSSKFRAYKAVKRIKKLFNK